MTDFESGNLNICLSTTQNITAFLTGGNVQVIVGNGAQLNFKQATNYIKSGEAEIKPLILQARTLTTNAVSAANQAQNALNEINDTLSGFAKITDSIFYEEI